MRFYDVAIASLAIDAPVKWTDNVLTQHDVRGVAPARRGVARRIPRPTLVLLALTRELHMSLAIGVRDALQLATRLLAEDPHEEARHEWRDGSITIVIDRIALERALDERLRMALESAPAPRRGRPPNRTPRK